MPVVIVIVCGAVVIVCWVRVIVWGIIVVLRIPNDRWIILHNFFFTSISAVSIISCWDRHAKGVSLMSSRSGVSSRGGR